MGQNTSVCLGKFFDNFVKVNISEGRYSNVNEIVCEGLRLLEEENKIKTLKKLLQEGLDSGIAEDFNPEKYLEFLKAKNRND